MLQGLNSSNAVTAFERMEEKVIALESEADATLQVRLCISNWLMWLKCCLSGAACTA